MATRKLLPAWLLLSLLVSSCSTSGQERGLPEDGDSSGDNPTATSEDDEDEPNFVSPVETTDPNPGRSDSSIEASPAEETLGAITDPNELALAWSEQATLEAEFITSCILQEGFDNYIELAEPVPSAQQFAGAFGPLRSDVGEGGYGVSISLRGQWITLHESSPSSIDDRDAQLLS